MSLNLIENYFQLLLSLQPYECRLREPIFSVELDIVESMVEVDENKSKDKKLTNKETKEYKDELNFIRKNTCKDLMIPLAVIEFVVFSNLVNINEKSIYNKLIIMRDNVDNERSLPLYKWMWYVKADALPKIKKIANNIAIKYNLELTYSGGSDRYKIF